LVLPARACWDNSGSTPPSRAFHAMAKATTAYVLSDQKTPDRFAGQKVKVTGTLFEKTKILQVDSITADSPAPTHQHQVSARDRGRLLPSYFTNAAAAS